MKTRFIVNKGWKILHTYDFIIPAIIGECFMYEGTEYEISGQIIDDKEMVIIYLLKE